MGALSDHYKAKHEALKEKALDASHPYTRDRIAYLGAELGKVRDELARVGKAVCEQRHDPFGHACLAEKEKR
ncbi:MAG TPA: hypothetical protein VM695_10055 [Phycisphaerae bacterium]|nr:hypothetical protein [Phycisphaerae bacterium]